MTNLTGLLAALNAIALVAGLMRGFEHHNIFADPGLDAIVGIAAILATATTFRSVRLSLAFLLRPIATYYLAFFAAGVFPFFEFLSMFRTTSQVYLWLSALILVSTGVLHIKALIKTARFWQRLPDHHVIILGRPVSLAGLTLQGLILANVAAFVLGFATNAAYEISFMITEGTLDSLFSFLVIAGLVLAVLPKFAFQGFIFPRLPVMFALGYTFQWVVALDGMGSWRLLPLLATVPGLALQAYTMSVLYKHQMGLRDGAA